ncbi:FlaA1/EpsC-like NDP-sugar epimerase [Gammaproteobacteria bacterium]
MKNLFLSLPRHQKQIIAAATDFICLPIIFYFALMLHFDSLKLEPLKEYSWLAFSTGAISIPIFIKLELYQAVIRYIDQKIISVVVIGIMSSLLVLVGLFLLIGNARLSPALFLIYGINATLYILASRFIARVFFLGTAETDQMQRVAIYGAGQAGNMLANALKSGREYYPQIFIDDNPQLQNTTIGGIKVYPSSQLKKLVAIKRINSILLAIPSLTRHQQREIFDRLEPLKIQIKITPPIINLVKGISRVEDMRQIEIEDLLGRDPVEPNLKLLSVGITGKTVMVSGAGGSIGSELCRQIINLNPLRLILLDNSEFGLYSIDQELQNLKSTQGLDVEILTFMGSVLDYEKCKDILSTFTVNTIYHAAAYKHVPLVEYNPVEGIRNNVFGTLNFAKAADTTGVECFILISTDKAVRPTNVMGATKRLSELILQSFSHQGSRTRFSMVRFGNVLGSSGSVVPLFRKQILNGGPITITHPEITRYFMTITEAAQLVLQTGSMATGGDVFVLDMGEPIRITELATRMVHLSGHEIKTPETPNGTIEIKYTGLRPGEKLYEELLIGTNFTITDHPLIMRAQEAEVDWQFLEATLKQLEEACIRNDHPAIRSQLRAIVQEYCPVSEIADILWKKIIAANHRQHLEQITQCRE